MAVNLDRLTAAINQVASGIDGVAAAIRNPATDTSSQQAVDSLADRLDAMSGILTDAVAAENLEDGTVSTPTTDTPVAEGGSGQSPEAETSVDVAMNSVNDNGEDQVA